ncbi:hypothetical protein KCU64_g15077, partial [Aureobasidium melanogenum]
PLLYQTYVKPNTIKTPLELKYIHGYLQTLLQRPGLARYVQNVCIKAWFQPGTLKHLLTDHVPEFWQWENLDRFPREPFLDDGTFEAFLSAEPIHDSQASTQLLSLYREHLEKLDITAQERESWYQALEAGQEDAEITLLLSLTTNLDKLTLIMPNWEYFERPSSLPHFTRIIGSNLFLRNLTSICVRSNYTGETFHELDDYGLECYQGFPFSFLLPFLALPSLQSAYITWAFDLNIAEEFVHTGLFSSNLKKLKLSHCAVHPRVLQDVMSRCIGLEVFVCHMPVSDWPVHELSKAMYLHRDSLRTIELDLCEWVYNDVETDGRGEWGATDDCYSKSFGFLTEYTALRNLTVSEDMLLQFSPDPMIDELLPSGLEKLHLNEISNLIDDSLPGNEHLTSLSIRGTVDALEFFLANTAPSLRTLEIVLPKDYAQSDRDVCESILRFTNLRELCLNTWLLDELPADGFAAIGQMNHLKVLKITPDCQDSLPGSSWTNNDFGEWISNFSELRELELLWRSSCLDENAMAAIGRSCQKLERCTLGWAQDISTWTALEDHTSVLFPRLKKLGICVVDEQSQQLQQVS